MLKNSNKNSIRQHSDSCLYLCLVLILVLLASISCDEQELEVEEKSVCIEDCFALCDFKKSCELETEAENKICYAVCSSTKKAEWGELYAVAPLSCGKAEDCNALESCILLGGKRNYSCDGNQVVAEIAAGVSKDCIGLCAISEICDMNYYGDLEYCRNECQMGIENGWFSSKVLECVSALTCVSYGKCYNALAYDWEDGDLPEPGPEEMEDEPEVVEPENIDQNL